MNWGRKIFILYAGFLLFVLTMVYFSMKENMDLVSPDYYEKELAFQDKINAGKNSADDHAGWSLSSGTNGVVMVYSNPTDAARLNGTVLFQRSSDATKDVTIKVDLDADGKQLFDTRQFVKGSYQVFVDWTISGKKYYQQLSLFVP